METHKAFHRVSRPVDSFAIFLLRTSYFLTDVPSIFQNGGVWVSNELWRAIRRQLESKVQEMNALVEEHQRVKANLTEALNKAQVREYEMEGVVRDMENVSHLSMPL